MASKADAAFQRALGAYGARRFDDARVECQKVLQLRPAHVDALNLLGVIALQTNQPELAVEMMGRAIALTPRNADLYNNRGVALLVLKRHDDAVASFDRAIELKSDYADAHNNRGNALHEARQYAAAVASYDRAIALRPEFSEAYNNRGNALLELRRDEAALASYARALSIDPKNVGALHNCGIASLHLERYAAAVDYFDRAITLKPDYADAHFNRGDALVRLGRHAAAIASYDRALALGSRHGAAYKNRGIAMFALDEHEAAVGSLNEAILLAPDDADAHFNRGNALFALRRLDAALADYDRAIALDAHYADAHLNRGNALHELQRAEAAIAAYDAAVAADPNSVTAYENRGMVLRQLRRYEAAVEDFDKAIALDPAMRPCYGVRRHIKMQMCDWDGLEADLDLLAAATLRDEAAVSPFCLLALSGSAHLQRRATEAWVRREGLLDRSLPPIGPRPRRDKIRIGYFSADFRDHPVALLTAEFLESHSRSRFDITAFSFGPDTQDDTRRRLEGAFDRFLDVRLRTDSQIALLARSMEIDIAVDLGGFTEQSRPPIFAMRAAPVQVSYIGYLGTLGAGYMDYLIADACIIPAESREHYTEKIVYLPTYQANDSRRPTADSHFSRAELGLPATGFVFCCFNANYKISPATFEVWMRILHRVEGSVLFLLSGHEQVEHNLRREAATRGIHPDRLVFGKALPGAFYRARYRAADLFLDTLPYNAGATASDALWAGLPVLTCAGEAFASRVAASLLQAVEFPELIASNPAQYEELAVDLARNPQRLAQIKQRLAAARRGAPLFDTPRFTRHLEDAYTQMYERHHSGLPPDHVHVASD